MRVTLQADPRPKRNQKSRELAGSSPRTIPIGKRTWTHCEPGEYSFSDYEVSKKLIHLLRHGSLPRENDGAIELHSGESKIIFRNISCIVIIGLTTSGRKTWQEDEDKRKDFSIVRIHQEQSCTSELFKAIQDAVSLILLYRTMLLFRAASSSTFITSDVRSILHSIINSGLIPRGQHLSNRQTVFFLLVDPMDKNHKDLDTIDLNEPRHAQYMHKSWKKHQNMVYWVDINFALKRGLKFYQTRSNAIILHETLPAYCIPKVVRMETGEVIWEKRPPPKISLKHDWMKELGSEVARQPEGEVARQAKSSQSSQPNPNPDHD